jgi:hypothetical protein
MKLSVAQQKVVDFLNAGSSTSSTAVYREFNKKTVDTLLSKGIIALEHHSRLRTDDMEMVYWSTFRVVTKLEQALK